MYSPIPNLMAMEATFIQWAPAIPEAIKTVPQTGGVIVESNANQKIKRCALKAGNPNSCRIGPATDTEIIYAAVVGTSIPKIRQANAVSISAIQRCP